MAHSTQIQRLTALVRDLACDSGETTSDVIRTFTLSEWHTDLAAFCADVPAQLVRDFCAVHAALTTVRDEVKATLARVTGSRVGGVQ